MELNKLLELYTALETRKGKIGWDAKDLAIYSYVKDEIYYRITPKAAESSACEVKAVYVSSNKY